MIREGLPAKLRNERRHRCCWSVVLFKKTSRLHLFKLFTITNKIGIPGSCCIFQMLTNQRNVSCSLGNRGTTIPVATYEVESFGSIGSVFGWYIVNTFVPMEITNASHYSKMMKLIWVFDEQPHSTIQVTLCLRMPYTFGAILTNTLYICGYTGHQPALG